MKTPEIINVKMKVENKVVEVTFADFTTEKAVCIEPDVFDMERAIATKVDIYSQVMMNFDVFASYCWNETHEKNINGE